jgi:hypothetical protein
MGLAVDNLQGGCCGLAGSWGFEADKYGISMDCGEQALLPAVRRAGPDTLVVAGGFSCQTQIADAGTGRHALHLAEVMKRPARAFPPPAGCPGRPRPGGWPGCGRRAAPVAVLGATAAAVTRTSPLRSARGRSDVGG